MSCAWITQRSRPVCASELLMNHFYSANRELSPMKEYQELLQKLEVIKANGYVRTHRVGDTGIGKTLEDLLEIEENNIPGPNGSMIELKSGRKTAKSMLTLITKSPKPEKANSVLLQRYGYPSEKGSGRRELHTTVNALGYNTLKKQTGFKIEVGSDRVKLVSESREVLGYWDEATLRERFVRKIPRLLYVKADSRGSGPDEEFWFNEAWLLSGFDFRNILELLKEGKILVDIRIGQYPDGKPHDHGTGFRIHPGQLELCFLNRKQVL
jgi:hypothetical protein